MVGLLNKKCQCQRWQCEVKCTPGPSEGETKGVFWSQERTPVLEFGKQWCGDWQVTVAWFEQQSPLTLSIQKSKTITILGSNTQNPIYIIPIQMNTFLLPSHVWTTFILQSFCSNTINAKTPSSFYPEWIITLAIDSQMTHT